MIDDYLNCDTTSRIDMYLLYPEKLKNIFINDEESINELETILFNITYNSIYNNINHYLWSDSDDMINKLNKLGIEYRTHNGKQFLLINIKGKGLWDYNKIVKNNIAIEDIEKIYQSEVEYILLDIKNYFRKKWGLELYQMGRSGGYLGFERDQMTIEDVNEDLLKESIHKFIIDTERIKKFMKNYDPRYNDPIDYIEEHIVDELIFNKELIDSNLLVIAEEVKMIFNDLKEMIEDGVERLNHVYSELINGTKYD